MAAPPPPDPVILIDDLVEEFLLRIPPEDPADLARAALVSRQWYRVITGPVFRRRFREFHRSAQLLGYFVNLPDSIRFVSMSSFRPPHAARRNAGVIHSMHGRVLLRRYAEEDEDEDLADVLLSVWDPITGEEWDLPVVPLSLDLIHKDYYFWDAAMVCAVGGGCNHLHCHFKVVFMGISQGRDFSCFYSSETGRWSDPVSCEGCFAWGSSVLVGSALYFSSARSNEILKYDLKTHQACTITLQHDAAHFEFDGLLIATEDGRLGAAVTVNSKLVILSSTEHGRWVESRVIELHTLLPDHTLCDVQDYYRTKPRVVGFAETGAGVIFLKTDDGYFTIDLNSERSKKVGEILPRSGDRIVPYVSFCTPAPGAVSTNEGLGDVVGISTDEGPGAGVAVSTEVVPVAGVAASTDEGPGAGDVVSTDEGLAAGGQVP